MTKIKTLPPDSVIKKKLSRIGNMPMTVFAHGYREGIKIKIIDAAKEKSNNYTEFSVEHPAVALMDVILAANRDYNKQVDKHVKNLREEYPRLSFTGLKKLIDKNDFIDFKKIWGHKDEKKFETLKSVLDIILKLKKKHRLRSDFEIMEIWAKVATVENRKNDPIGMLPNIGIATYQHLKMAFGANTVKPDLRVKQVFKKEFGLSLSPEECIITAHNIADITKYSPLMIDQIFVKYGSGYYRSEIQEIKQKVENIIKELLRMKVPVGKICKATKWSLEEVNSLK